MESREIPMVSVANVAVGESVMILDQEIKGTTVWAHSLTGENGVSWRTPADFARMILVCQGTAEFTSGKERTVLTGPAVYVPSIQETAASGCCQLLELQIELEAGEYQRMRESGVLPYALEYEKARRYTEDCKSDKTVSRMLIPPRIVPRFSMGSVETGGDDAVAAHAHPMLEQYFFGLADNNCVLCVDDVQVPFGGNTLLHIPLGSEHGILSRGGQKVRYIWMDLLFDDDGLEYMDAAHQMIDP